MEGNDRQRTHNDVPSFSSAGGIVQNPPTQTGHGTSDRFRQPALLASHSSTPAPAVDRGGGSQGYGFGYAEGSQYAAPPLPGSSLQYQPDYSQDPQRQQQYAHYGSNLMYNVPAQAPPQSPYDTVPPYQPRQSAAIEVLSTQFGVPQYFVPGEPTSAPGPALPLQSAPAQFQSLPYSQQNPVARSSLGHSYSSGMADLSQGSAQVPLEAQEFGQEATNYDDAYEQYQNALKQTFENTRAGRIAEAGQSLLEISEWLLGHAVDLGLVRDEQELHSDRLKLWTEFNTCWLAVLQKQKDLTQDMLDTGQPPQPPQSLLQLEFMERMGKDLIRLCDTMERHGLVDYQMGVWEEEIINILQECLGLLEDDDTSPQAGRSGTHL